VLAAATGATAAATLEEVVGKHLAWLRATDNYLAELRMSGLKTGDLGTVFVDNTVSPAQVWFEGDLEFPNKVTRKLAIVGTANDTQAAVGEHASVWTLDKGPFGRSFAPLERGLTVEEAVRRLRVVSSKVTVLENPQGGVTGIRLVSEPDFLTRMDTLLASVLAGGVLPRTVDSTVWFSNANGRIERMTLTDLGAESFFVTLNYLGTNLPASRARTYRRAIEMRSKTKVHPSFYEMFLAISQQDAKAGEPKGK
jgi:hypothetical protein